MTRNRGKTEREQIGVVINENEKKQEPRTTRDVVSSIQQNKHVGEEDYEFLAELESESRTYSPTKESHEHMSFSGYVFSSEAVWYWLTLLLGITAALAIVVIPEDAFPLVHLRLALGLFFILFLPGFVLTKSLFPNKMPIKTSSERMDKLERVVLSLGISLILTPMVGLILNYTPWGVRLLPLTVGLLMFTVGLATVGMFRESRLQCE